MEDLNVIDVAFLHGTGYNASTLGLICKEPDSKLYFKVYEADHHRSKELSQILWKREICDTQAFIIPGILNFA